jgi:hypothetical protein
MWRGTYTRGASSGTMTLQLTQSGAGVTGTWSTDLEGVEFDQAGSLGGTATGSRVALFLTPAASLICSSGITLSGTLSLTASVEGDRLSGDVVALECESVATGRIEVTRQ